MTKVTKTRRKLTACRVTSQNSYRQMLLFLVRFFRNLLMGESNTLKNRYMMIDGPEEWKLPESEQTPREDRTSTGQTAH